MTDRDALKLPSRMREGLGVGSVPGIPRPTERAKALRRESTPAERVLWRRLSGRKIGFKFSRQMPVGPFIADFMCRSAMLIVEIDGYSHDLSVNADDRRSAFLRSRGFHVLRFTNAEVLNNVEGVVLAICGFLQTTNNPSTSPFCKREGGF